MTAQLRPATAADTSRLTKLVDAAYGGFVERIGRPPEPMTRDYAEIVRERDVTVVESGGEIVALLVLAVTDEGFLIENVAVDPAHQGTGLGRLLLECAEEAARAIGFDSLYLYTHERIVENLELYERIGYVEFDRRPAGEGKVVYLRKQLG